MYTYKQLMRGIRFKSDVYRLSGDEPRIQVTSVVGDLTDAKQVLAAFDGVTSVIHTAGLISKATFPDSKALYRVNVIGEEQFSRQ